MYTCICIYIHIHIYIYIYIYIHTYIYNVLRENCCYLPLITSSNILAHFYDTSYEFERAAPSLPPKSRCAAGFMGNEG